MKRPARGVIVQQDTSRMIAGVPARIPPALGKVEPPNEGQRVVDDDRFLMVRRADRMRPVFVKMQPAMGREL